MTGTRFLYAPLEAYIAARHRPEDGELGGRAIGAAVGFSPKTVNYWQHVGHLTVDTADKCAVALGQHPSAIWPEWWHT